MGHSGPIAFPKGKTHETAAYIGSRQVVQAASSIMGELGVHKGDREVGRTRSDLPPTPTPVYSA